MDRRRKEDGRQMFGRTPLLRPTDRSIDRSRHHFGLQEGNADTPRRQSDSEGIAVRNAANGPWKIGLRGTDGCDGLKPCLSSNFIRSAGSVKCLDMRKKGDASLNLQIPPKRPYRGCVNSPFERGEGRAVERGLNALWYSSQSSRSAPRKEGKVSSAELLSWIEGVNYKVRM